MSNFFSRPKNFPAPQPYHLFLYILLYKNIFLVGTDLTYEIQTHNQFSLTSDLLAEKICQKDPALEEHLCLKRNTRPDKMCRFCRMFYNSIQQVIEASELRHGVCTTT